MNKQRQVILIIAIIGMLATFMPWVNIPIIGAINGARGIGWLTLILYAIPAVVTLLNDRTKQLEGASFYLALVPGIICSIIAIYKIIEFNSAMGDSGTPYADDIGSGITIGFGLYLVILAGIAIPASAYLLKEQPKAE